MRHPLIQQGEGPAAAYYRQRQEREDERKRLNAIIDAVYNDDTNTILSLLGDELQLRGIPALARGVPGAISGTKPGSGL